MTDAATLTNFFATHGLGSGGGGFAGTGNISNINTAFAQKVFDLNTSYNAATGGQLTFSSGARSSFGEPGGVGQSQATHFNNYQNGTGGLAAAPSNSFHESGLAVDVIDPGYPGGVGPGVNFARANSGFGNAGDGGASGLNHIGANDMGHLQNDTLDTSGGTLGSGGDGIATNGNFNFSPADLNSAGDTFSDTPSLTNSDFNGLTDEQINGNDGFGSSFSGGIGSDTVAGGAIGTNTNTFGPTRSGVQTIIQGDPGSTFDATQGTPNLGGGVSSGMLNPDSVAPNGNAAPDFSSLPDDTFDLPTTGAPAQTAPTDTVATPGNAQTTSVPVAIGTGFNTATAGVGKAIAGAASTASSAITNATTAVTTAGTTWLNNIFSEGTQIFLRAGIGLLAIVLIALAVVLIAMNSRGSQPINVNVAAIP
jgi:hypothetical protein